MHEASRHRRFNRRTPSGSARGGSTASEQRARRYLVASAVAVTGLLLAGCGGDDGDADAAAAATTIVAPAAGGDQPAPTTTVDEVEPCVQDHDSCTPAGPAPTAAPEAEPSDGVLTVADGTELTFAIGSCDLTTLFLVTGVAADDATVFISGSDGRGRIDLQVLPDENGKNFQGTYSDYEATAVVDGNTLTLTGTWAGDPSSTNKYPSVVKGDPYTFTVAC